MKDRRFHPLQPNWRSSTYSDRFNAIECFVLGKRVLDIGVTSGFGRPDWMHGKIAEVASSVVGVDVDAEGVERVRQEGFDVRLIDAQGIHLDEEFEVVFAGELIEHLANFESFLSGVEAHLAKNGRFILSTPNAFCFSNFVYRFGFKARVHPEHTCWFCEDTLTQLLQRFGFKVVEVRYLAHRTPGMFRRVFAGIAHKLLPAKLAWRTIMVVAKKEDASVV